MATRKEYDGYDAATSITSNDLIKYKDGTSGTVYKITEENLSAQVQADLFDNAATTEAEVSTALSVIEKNGTISRITLQDLMIQMKGYREYTFAIRQSGTDAPTISVIKDDFELEAPLTFTRQSQGIYIGNITSLGLLSNIYTNVYVSNPNGGLMLDIASRVGCLLNAPNSIILRTEAYDDGEWSMGDFLLGNQEGLTISIRETLH